MICKPMSCKFILKNGVAYNKKFGVSRKTKKMKLTKIIIFLLIGFTCCGQDNQELKNIESFYHNGDLEKTIEKGKELLKKDSTDLMVNYLLGRALADRKKFEEAKKYLSNSIREESPDWMKSWSYGYLGTCNYMTDNFEKAKTNLTNAIELNATKNSTKFANERLKWFQMGKYFDEWEIIETSNIRFHIQPNHEIEDLKEYCELRQKAYETNNNFFKALPYKKIDFYVWSKPKEGEIIMGKPIGFANSDLCIINSRIEQTKGHEITHIISDHGIKPKKKNQLINEGVAVAFDMTNRNRIAMAKSANVEKLGVKELMEKAKAYPESTLYPIGGALIEFLRNDGNEESLKSLIQNQTWENLIEIYGENKIEEFEKLITE
jgi:tetratricopeptide (TPR) repeat protein